MNHSVLPIALGSSGSASTRWKFSRPTNTGSDTRFVSWTLITKPRRMGNQAKTPNTRRKGSRKTSVREAVTRDTQPGDPGTGPRARPPVPRR